MSKLHVPVSRVAKLDLVKDYALDGSLTLLIVLGLAFWMLALLH